jgi:hypothetical protein
VGDGAAFFVTAFFVTAFSVNAFFVACGASAVLVGWAAALFGGASLAAAFFTAAFFVAAGLTAAFLVTIVFRSSAIVTHSPRWLQINIPSSRGALITPAFTRLLP